MHDGIAFILVPSLALVFYVVLEKFLPMHEEASIFIMVAYTVTLFTVSVILSVLSYLALFYLVF